METETNHPKINCAEFKHLNSGNKYWPDAPRKYMLSKSEFYAMPEIYHYGFYDAFQYQNAKIDRAIELIQRARSYGNADALLQDAILTLMNPLT